MRGANPKLEEVPTAIPIDGGGEMRARVCFQPGLVKRCSPCVFLANGFSANEKTWTFRPLAKNGEYSTSFMEYLASQGIVVVVKKVGSERTTLEPDFESHVRHVPQLVRGAAVAAAEAVESVCGKRYPRPAGVHWIGHSLGGMEVMPVKDRGGMMSFTALGSPTAMGPYDATNRAFAEVMAKVVGLGDYQRNIPIPIELFGRVSNQFFKKMRIRSDSELNHDQRLLVGMLMHLPGFNTISHTFLNMDHMDAETSVAFFRTALSDETVYLMVEFCRAALAGESTRGMVMGRPIEPLRIPTLVIAGDGDRIAPPQSCEALVEFVKNPRRYSFTFDEYDHLGMLVRHSAMREIWPIVSVFVHESHAVRIGDKKQINEAAARAAAVARNRGNGVKCRRFAEDALRRLKKPA